MPEVSLGLAFSAGLFAIINPCALGMIPAYLALQAEAGRTSARRFMNGVVGLVAGFVGIFSAVALAIALFGHVLLRAVPFVAATIGVGLIVVGLLTLAGRSVHLRLPWAGSIRGSDSFAGQILFGATYALGSLGCALPVFLTFAAAALADRSPIALAGNIAAFALGAAVMVTALVIVGALGGRLGRSLPHQVLSRYASGGLLTAAGAYLLYLQLGFLIGYPFGIPVITLPL